jgi:hypothetical protein
MALYFIIFINKLLDCVTMLLLILDDRFANAVSFSNLIFTMVSLSSYTKVYSPTNNAHLTKRSPAQFQARNIDHEAFYE